MTENDVFDALKTGAVLLTPNRRLSASLSERFQQQQDAKHWPTPQILPLSAYLVTCYQTLSLKTLCPVLLNEHQALALWQDIIASSDTDLLNPSATAKTALEAWRLSQQWQITWNLDVFESSPDQLAYHQWAEQFDTILSEQGLMDSAQLPALLSAHADALSLPETLIFSGFHEFTPALQSWQAQLHQTDCLRFDYQLEASVQARYRFSDQQKEMKAMAAWAKQQLDTGQQRIACVVPKLAQLRSAIARIFMDELGDPNLIDISAGKPLNEYPLIHTALTLLSLNGYVNPLSTWESLLRSPFLAGAESEFIARAELVAKLRAQNEFMLTRKQVMTQAEDCPQFAERLSALFAQSAPDTLAPSAWAQFFSDRLQAIAWPGERDLNSFEYQVLQRFLACFDELASFDLIYPSLTQKKAHSVFSDIIKATVFQPQSVKARIQILGVLEAAGSCFDAIWVMGLDDETWPAAAKPNPFIPYAIQRELQLPHANAQRELEFSQAIMQQFTSACQQFHASFASSDGDRELGMSRLLLDLPERQFDLAVAESLMNKRQRLCDLDYFSDEQAPALAADEAIHGGSFVFKSQATCPFQAFARYRLGAEGLDSPHTGLNALERGITLHRALEIFWRDTKNHAALLALSEDALTARIESVIASACQNLIRQRPNSISEGLLALERERLQVILSQWLALEKKRPPFDVLAQEKKVDVHVAGLSLSTRLDRLDKTEDGAIVLIDYKTGQTNPAHWFGERMEEPQLPLYAISQSEVDALVFASLRCDQIEMKGVSQDELDLPGVKSLEKIRVNDKADSWSAQLAEWRDGLVALSTAFQHGDAAVAPKHAQSCAYCDLQAFCRIGD